MELVITKQEYDRIKHHSDIDFKQYECKDGVIIRISPNDYNYVFDLLSNKTIKKSRRKRSKKSCCSWFNKLIY